MITQRYRNNTLLKSGFTLIELAIVLVIIGLIVGGILVGSALINSAKLRSNIAQYENYVAATLAFKIKYNALPGDLDSRKATQYGFIARSGAAARGDGNGLIENATGAFYLNTCTGEMLAFWKDLYDANMIDFRPTNPYILTMTMPNNGTEGLASGSRATIALITNPTAKYSENSMWAAYSNQGYNYFLLTGGVYNSTFNFFGVCGAAPQFVNSVTPSDAYFMDTKRDDGAPQTGAVRAITGTNFPWDQLATPAAPASGVCVSNAAGNPYNTLGNFGDIPSCQLRIRMF